MSITGKQVGILRHAIGWPRGSRNSFVTDEGTTDFQDCEALVELGMMRKHDRSWVTGFIYVVTGLGRDVANSKVETSED